jgi:hypothetical protein
MQKILPRLSRLVWKGRPSSRGTRRAFLQHRESLGIEAVDDGERCLPVATDLVGSGWCSLAASGCEQNLAAAQDKGVFRASACLDVAAFVFGQRSNGERSFHALSHTTLSIPFREFALVIGFYSLPSLTSCGRSEEKQEHVGSRNQTSSIGGAGTESGCLEQIFS